MSAELAVIPQVSLETTLEDAQQQVAALIERGESGVLDEARRRAEAQSLYERRAKDEERERHYAKLRLLAEAALGVLSFDSPEVVETAAQRASWRALAAAYERGQLLAICEQSRLLSTSVVVNLVRGRGLTYVAPGAVPWKEARVSARRTGQDLTALPVDLTALRRREALAQESSARMTRHYRASERYERMMQQKLIAAAASEKGPRTDEAFSLLRKCLQKMHEAQFEFERGEERQRIDRVFGFLNKAVDELAVALELRPDNLGENHDRLLRLHATSSSGVV